MSREVKPRVMIITHIKGGIAHYTAHLQEKLKKYFKLYFVTFKKHYKSGELLNKPGDSLIAKHIKSPYYLIEHDSPSSLVDLLSLIKKLKINLVNIQFCTAFMPVVLYYTVLCKKLHQLGIPVILTCHDVLEHTPTKNGVLALKLLYDEADHFLVGNKSELGKLARNFSIPKKKVAIIEHGVYDKFDRKKYTRESARKYLRLKNKTVILFFGYLKKYKGILTLIDAMKWVVAEDKNVILNIVGSVSSEDLSKLIRKKIKNNKLSRNVILNSNYVPIKEIEAIYKAADIVALPYTNVSQSGILCLSLYFKKPVIITNIFAEAPVLHKKMGLVVKPNNPRELAKAIIYLLKNPDIAKKYGIKGYRYMGKRSWDSIAKKLHAVFSKFIT